MSQYRINSIVKSLLCTKPPPSDLLISPLRSNPGLNASGVGIRGKCQLAKVQLSTDTANGRAVENATVVLVGIIGGTAVAVADGADIEIFSGEMVAKG